MAFSLQMVLYMGGTSFSSHSSVSSSNGLFTLGGPSCPSHCHYHHKNTNIIMVPGIVLYAPALALSAVTGLHFEGAVIGIGDHMIHVARNNNNNNNNK